MARQLRRDRYNPAFFAQAQNDPKIYSSPLRPFGFKGHDKTSPISRMGEGYCRLVRNLMFRDGRYETRLGTINFGNSVGFPIVHAQEVILSTGGIYDILFDTSGVYVLEGGNWIATSGDAWSTTDLRAFSITGWGDSVVFAEDTVGVFRLNLTGAYPKTKLIDLPGVHHLATFAGRIIASLDDRIQWTVKNNETDWEGVGSGFEDLRSAMGGRPDGQTAVVPISDDTALCLRTNSVWLMRTTGDFDAPFIFTLLEQGKGCKWPRTVQAISGGAIWLGDDGVVYMNAPDQYGRRQTSNISQPIYKSFQRNNEFLRRASSMYNPRYDEYRLTVPDGSATSTVHRFSRIVGWTEDTYPIPIRSMSFAMFGEPLTIDQLVGTIDGLVGAIDDLTNNNPSPKTLFSQAYRCTFDPNQVLIENKATTIAVDVGAGGFSQLGSFRLETSYIRAADPLHRTETLQLITEYEALQASTLNYYYSDDNGVTWNLLLAVPIVPTSKPVQLTLDYTLDRQDIQFAIESVDMIDLKIIDFFVMARQGGLKSDAN